MVRLMITMRAALALALLSPMAGPAPVAAQAPEVENIGFVLYTRTQTPGTLIARWSFANAYSGPGLATGGPREGFAGQYHVRYFFETGEFSDEYELEIERKGDFYEARWVVEGKVRAHGVGMEVDDGRSLAIGWHRV